MATALGATVLAGASSEDKRRAARAAGAVAVLDTSAQSLKDAAREFSNGGVDLVYDPVGGDLADPALRSLRVGGRYLVIGFASGTIPSLPLNQVLLRNRSVVGVDWGAWSMSAAAGQHALRRGYQVTVSSPIRNVRAFLICAWLMIFIRSSRA
ncbi:zinc-binding dehydrogenase [Streptosporangium sp. NPDC002607]